MHSSFEFLPQLLILDFENPPTEAWYVTDIKSTKVYILTLLYPFPNLQIYKPFLPGLPLKKVDVFIAGMPLLLPESNVHVTFLQTRYFKCCTD